VHQVGHWLRLFKMLGFAVLST